MSEKMKEFERWLNQTSMDEQLRSELLALKQNEALDEIEDRFYRDLEFGTGGLRGIIGAGTNRMNIYTVRKATRGLAVYVNKYYKNPSVAVSYDSRINSRLFAKTAAEALMASGIEVYMYDTLMPAPALSFATRYHRCAMGIMITASHNPAKYNGYKVYNEQGCQVTENAAEEILAYIRSVDIFEDQQDSKIGAMLHMMGDETKNAFYDAVESEKMRFGTPEEEARDMSKLSVVYTPLNGTGNKPVREILKRIGVKQIHVVEEQELPDGNFPTCAYPNPERREALEKGLELCTRLSEMGAAPDLLMATDPDCDRIGLAACRESEKSYGLLTGNETGILLFDFICKMRSEAGTMPEDPVAIRTIVSSKMIDAIAADYGVEVKAMLSGFKYIGEEIGRLEKNGEEARYIFGFEESYGYLSGAYVRDKDAVGAAMLIAQMTAYYKKQSKSLLDRLEELYKTYGYYINETIDFAFEGEKGMNEMALIMSEFRNNPPRQMIGKCVVKVVDYEKPTGLPNADVVEFELEDGTCAIVRPSGTEPKLKIYLSTKTQGRAESGEVISALKAEVKAMI